MVIVASCAIQFQRFFAYTKQAGYDAFFEEPLNAGDAASPCAVWEHRVPFGRSHCSVWKISFQSPRSLRLIERRQKTKRHLFFRNGNAADGQNCRCAARCTQNVSSMFCNRRAAIRKTAKLLTWHIPSNSARFPSVAPHIALSSNRKAKGPPAQKADGLVTSITTSDKSASAHRPPQPSR